MRLGLGIICGIAIIGLMAVVFIFSSAWRSEFINFWQTSPVDNTASLSNANSAPALPIPRFVSIKANSVNMRRGPSTDHDIIWQFVRKGQPVEIIAEYEHWRRIRDVDGEEGWVYHAMLSGKRTALVAPWGDDLQVSLLSSPDVSARRVAMVESGVLANIEKCDGEWCHLSFSTVTHKGWIKQKALWGAYIGEQVN